ncbi:MAG: ornithine decarboxylase [Rhodospirillaceae bacterium]|nr:ornithine decarboxylase [Rhodospirillaceae bacterium]
MIKKIDKFLKKDTVPSPCLVVDLEIVVENFQILSSLLPETQIYYAIKANPARAILQKLWPLKSRFDAASIYEIRECLSVGVDPMSIAFGNTIKKRQAIREAYLSGVRLFAIDSSNEVEKISKAAPGSSIYCRFQTNCFGADWPLSNKFGVQPSEVLEILRYAKSLGLAPVGLSFHVGSQQRNNIRWDEAIAQAARLFKLAQTNGINLEILNIGGGFTSNYRGRIPSIQDTCEGINKSVRRHFGHSSPQLIAEPGRYIVGDAGIIETEVISVSTKANDLRRWIYIDIGKFGGLIETLGEAIRYRIDAPYNDGPSGPVILAGPTCDDMDVLYQSAIYELPLSIVEGDRLRIYSAGAYTASYSAVNFNGFPPLSEYYI